MNGEKILNWVIGGAFVVIASCVASLAIWATANIIIHGHLP